MRSTWKYALPPPVIVYAGKITKPAMMSTIVAELIPALPEGYTPWPRIRLGFRFGSFQVSCEARADAVRSLAARLAKGEINNISGFTLPKPIGNRFSKSAALNNATTLDKDLLDFTN